MSEKRFTELVEQTQGFEFTQAFRDDADHILGGKGNTYWYVVMQDGSVRETWIGEYKNGAWSDRYFKGKSAKKAVEKPAGSTIRRIAKQAYLGQDEDWVKNRKGRLVQDAHPHYHYVLGFGDKALDVSERWGVTIGYSDIHDVPAGFHLRFVYTGDEVEMP